MEDDGGGRRINNDRNRDKHKEEEVEEEEEEASLKQSRQRTQVLRTSVRFDIVRYPSTRRRPSMTGRGVEVGRS